MIYYLSGTLLHISDATVVVENQGIAWELSVSQNSKASLEAQIEQKVTLFTWVNVSDRGIVFYGFASIDERNLFLSLIKVEGIGPKAAIKILSQTTPAKLNTCIRDGNVAALSEIVGIGKKKAQKILFALQHTIPMLAPPSEGTDMLKLREDLIASLTNMGYTKNNVEQALDVVLKTAMLSEEALPQIMKQLIAYLSK